MLRSAREQARYRWLVFSVKMHPADRLGFVSKGVSKPDLRSGAPEGRERES